MNKNQQLFVRLPKDLAYQCRTNQPSWIQEVLCATTSNNYNLDQKGDELQDFVFIRSVPCNPHSLDPCTQVDLLSALIWPPRYCKLSTFYTLCSGAIQLEGLTIFSSNDFVFVDVGCETCHQGAIGKIIVQTLHLNIRAPLSQELILQEFAQSFLHTLHRIFSQRMVSIIWFSDSPTNCRIYIRKFFLGYLVDFLPECSFEFLS